MEKVTIDDLALTSNPPAAVQRNLTGPLGTEAVALNYYELETGDSFAYAYHNHGVQEELFYVIEGTATFETESGDVEVGAGEVVRFPPGEYQRGTNRGGERVVALALGAPLEYGEMDKTRDCPDCGAFTSQTFGMDGEEYVASCTVCGTETGRWPPAASR
ncbi:MAG: cupin domain-containing protein [Halobacteriales archaeon]|nr:cupin domain-containing protein [Halobacteriales archaeon]